MGNKTVTMLFFILRRDSVKDEYEKVNMYNRLFVIEMPLIVLKIQIFAVLGYTFFKFQH